jgi:hypothetical protein
MCDVCDEQVEGRRAEAVDHSAETRLAASAAAAESRMASHGNPNVRTQNIEKLLVPDGPLTKPAAQQPLQEAAYSAPFAPVASAPPLEDAAGDE